jgi:predicted DNA-binding transcriptional regulator YafY
MARSDRLLRLIQLLRTLPQPVTAARLAEETGVSARTLYRDIDALRAGGVLIDGEAGYGYRLVEDPALPPLMFSRLEIEALVLGLAEVAQIGDAELADAARAAQAKLVAALPERVQRQALHAVLLVHRFRHPPAAAVDAGTLRAACWSETALDIDYGDAEGRRSRRRIWPLSVVYLDDSPSLLAWCCLRQDFRAFRLDRIVTASATEESFRPRRAALLRDYLARLRGG